MGPSKSRRDLSPEGPNESRSTSAQNVSRIPKPRSENQAPRKLVDRGLDIYRDRTNRSICLGAVADQTPAERVSRSTYRTSIGWIAATHFRRQPGLHTTTASGDDESTVARIHRVSLRSAPHQQTPLVRVGLVRNHMIRARTCGRLRRYLRAQPRVAVNADLGLEPWASE